MAETSSSKSDEEREEMLDRLLTRLALSDDSKLQPLLSKLVPYTISSLSSHSSAVRNKVMEILSHVNKRVKHQPEIGLPLSELWTIFSGADSAPKVRNFCILYMEMAMDRADSKEKENLSPMLLVGVSKLSNQHQEIILRLVVKVIGECHPNGIDGEIAAKECPPGLSIAQANRVTSKQSLNSDMLLKRKLGILNVIEAMELAPELVYPLYLTASIDCQEPVVKRGVELVKKKAAGANFDDTVLINRLFLLFNGTATSHNVGSESRVTPAGPALKGKLMSIFCRSITAANSFPSTLQCIFGCIYGSDTTSRLKQLGMEFTVWVFKHNIYLCAGKHQE